MRTRAQGIRHLDILADGSIRSAAHRTLHAGLEIALLCAAAFVLAGCLSPKYKAADKNTPPARVLNINFPAAPVEANLNTVITFGGPGSWKREAFWDEYVVSLRNPGDQPLQVGAITLQDFAGTPRSPGDDPWALERESKTLEKKYHDAGMAFARIAGPRVLVTAAEPQIVATAGVGATGAAAAATATAVALPVYGVAIWSVNSHHKAQIKAQFERRRLNLPLTLSPGETRTGSLFFPMVPNPHSLTVSWSYEAQTADLVLPLEFLSGLHMTEKSVNKATLSSPSH
jgi:hypothetical protein